MQKSRFFIDPIFWPYVTIEKSQDVTQIDQNFYDASFCILLCFRDRKRERERKRIERERERKKQRETYTYTNSYTHRDTERESRPTHPALLPSSRYFS